MRPVQRGRSPQSGDFDPYRDALRHLVSRMGPYCRYCERRVCTQLAVEHIQPKAGPNGRPDLIGRWENYLLACVNCNSAKKDTPVELAHVVLPDRDNTSLAFRYTPDGKVQPADGLDATLHRKAQDTLSLTGLDRPPSSALDENSRLIALDRVSQRLEAWALAEEVRADVEACPGNEAVKRLAVLTAGGNGFFSIWMSVFIGDPDMRNRLVDAFTGTRGSGCFDPVTALPVSPAPNPDGLPDGSKT